MIKYIGLAAILLSVFFFSSEYARFERKKISETEEFLRFLKHIKTQLSCYMAPMPSWLGSFSSELFDSAGFSEAFSESKDICEAFSLCESKFHMDKKAKALLTSFFAEAGHSYLKDEVALVDKTLADFSEYLNSRRLESPKNIKIASVVSLALALGFIMLVV